MGVAIFAAKRLAIFQFFFFGKLLARLWRFSGSPCSRQDRVIKQKEDVFCVILKQLSFLLHAKKVRNKEVRVIYTLIPSADCDPKKVHPFAKKIPFLHVPWVIRLVDLRGNHIQSSYVVFSRLSIQILQLSKESGQ